MLSHSYQSRLKVGTCQSLVLWQLGFYRPMFLLKVQVIIIKPRNSRASSSSQGVRVNWVELADSE